LARVLGTPHPTAAADSPPQASKIELKNRDLSHGATLSTSTVIPGPGQAGYIIVSVPG
jgi:hypothetical protein